MIIPIESINLPFSRYPAGLTPSQFDLYWDEPQEDADNDNDNDYSDWEHTVY